MKLVALHPQPYLLAYGGLCVAQRAMFESMARLGHEITVVTTATTAEQVPHEVRGTSPEELPVRHREGVEVLEISDPDLAHDRDAMRDLVSKICARKGVDLVVVAEDVLSFGFPAKVPQMGAWTRVAADVVGPSRVVYCCHSASSVPFGPHSHVQDAEASKLFGALKSVITVSQQLKHYLSEWTTAPVHVVPFPVYGPPPFRDLRGFDRGTVGFINPSVIKGSPVFLEIARRMPHRRFIAVPTWAESAAVREAMARLPNVEVVPPAADRDALYSQFSLLVVPSLWFEAWGLVVVEAMLRGVPVLAADHGGLREAKLGVPYLLPVRPLERVNPGAMDDIDVPMADVTPWVQTIDMLLSDRDAYERLADEGKRKSESFVRGLDPRAFEAAF